MDKRFAIIETAITALLAVLCAAGAVSHLWRGNFATVLWFGWPLCFVLPALKDNWRRLFGDESEED